MSKIKPKECQNVEFKTSWNDKYLEWICGFANAQGAVMYFGVNDDHEVEGFESAGLPMPKVENFCGGVRVTFQRKSATETATENATTQKTTQKNVEKIVENSVEKSVEKVWRKCGD